MSQNFFSLASANAIAPEPVPRSKTDILSLKGKERAISTSSSVSGLGIIVAVETFSGRDQNSRTSVMYAIGFPSKRSVNN